MTAWDRRLALRASALAGLCALLVTLIVVTTDEGAPWARRVAMVAALLPVAGALATAAAIRIAESRGELRALEALGVDPVRVVRGAVLGGVVVGMLGPLLTLSGQVDLGGLFPRPAAKVLWITSGAGMRELGQGLQLDPGGTLLLVGAAPSSGSTLPEGTFAFTMIALALSALGGPLWSGAPRLSWVRLIAGLVALLSSLIAFQAVAAGRLSPGALLVGPLIVLIDGTAARYLARRDA